ncbi:MAG: polysaccharide deacetylase family protein [Actinobacteria bacterium]|nr:polysaccharide deacetylase family protein [Actinomycetota bacterium]
MELPTVAISYPKTYQQERQYICDVIFREFLGLDYRIREEDRLDTRITLLGDHDKRELLLPDILFQIPIEQWLTKNSLPKQPLEWWTVSEVFPKASLLNHRLPVIFGRALQGEKYYAYSGNKITLGIDIFGSAFFMLTRYEEMVKSDRDHMGRFPAQASLAYREGFLTRPVVNEYLEVLWLTMESLWPGLQRKRRLSRVYLSHDVDHPLYAIGKSVPQVLKSTIGDMIKRKDLVTANHRIRSFAQAWRGNLDNDIYNTFEFIMRLSEQHGLRSAFYFITDHSAREIDGFYSIDDPWIRKLLWQIHKRGHEIGLHLSYNTFNDPLQIQQEFMILKRVCEEEGIHQDLWGGRQHYLRWQSPITWQYWEDVGLNYDSTLTFADHVGFRCGVCYEYSVFNLKQRSPLNLRERPLIIMEATLLRYMGLPFDKISEEISELKKRCDLFNGDFTMLWHNSSLVSCKEKALYQNVIREIAG